MNATEYAENVCRGLHLPIRGLAFVYIENAIQAALDECTQNAFAERDAAKAEIAVIWQSNAELRAKLADADRVLTAAVALTEANTALNNTGAAAVLDEWSSCIIALYAAVATYLEAQSEQESFQDAVRNDPDMTPERKAKWLSP